MNGNKSLILVIMKDKDNYAGKLCWLGNDLSFFVTSLTVEKVNGYPTASAATLTYMHHTDPLRPAAYPNQTKHNKIVYKSYGMQIMQYTNLYCFEMMLAGFPVAFWYNVRYEFFIEMKNRHV